MALSMQPVKPERSAGMVSGHCYQWENCSWKVKQFIWLWFINKNIIPLNYLWHLVLPWKKVNSGAVQVMLFWQSTGFCSLLGASSSQGLAVCMDIRGFGKVWAGKF